ncbi:MAG: hypothetical protein PVI30_04270 [Myxococcales bacterium]
MATPSGYDANRPVRLIFTWHYLGGSASGIARGGYYGLELRSGRPVPRHRTHVGQRTAQLRRRPVHWCEFSGGHTRPSFAPDTVWAFFEQF